MRMLRLLSAQAKNKQIGSFSMSKWYNDLNPSTFFRTRHLYPCASVVQPTPLPIPHNHRFLRNQISMQSESSAIEPITSG